MITIIEGDLLEQTTDAVVNTWNRNIIPWCLLVPQGVSGAIPLGGAVATGAGRLPYKIIIHVAGINMLWRASRASICNSVRNAVALAEQLQLASLAMPIIGAGSGGFARDAAEAILLETLQAMPVTIDVVVVRFRPR